MGLSGLDIVDVDYDDGSSNRTYSTNTTQEELFDCEHQPEECFYFKLFIKEEIIDQVLRFPGMVEYIQLEKKLFRSLNVMMKEMQFKEEYNKWDINRMIRLYKKIIQNHKSLLAEMNVLNLRLIQEELGEEWDEFLFHWRGDEQTIQQSQQWILDKIKEKLERIIWLSEPTLLRDFRASLSTNLVSPAEETVANSNQTKLVQSQLVQSNTRQDLDSFENEMIHEINTKLKSYIELANSDLRQVGCDIRDNYKDITSQAKLLKEHTENFNSQFIALETRSEGFLKYIQVERQRIDNVESGMNNIDGVTQGVSREVKRNTERLDGMDAHFNDIIKTLNEISKQVKDNYMEITSLKQSITNQNNNLQAPKQQQSMQAYQTLPSLQSVAYHQQRILSHHEQPGGYQYQQYHPKLVAPRPQQQLVQQPQLQQCHLQQAMPQHTQHPDTFIQLDQATQPPTLSQNQLYQLFYQIKEHNIQIQKANNHQQNYHLRSQKTFQQRHHKHASKDAQNTSLNFKRNTKQDNPRMTPLKVMKEELKHEKLEPVKTKEIKPILYLKKVTENLPKSPTPKAHENDEKPEKKNQKLLKTKGANNTNKESNRIIIDKGIESSKSSLTKFPLLHLSKSAKFLMPHMTTIRDMYVTSPMILLALLGNLIESKQN